jgi:hypothetical protein
MNDPIPHSLDDTGMSAASPGGILIKPRLESTMRFLVVAAVLATVGAAQSQKLPPDIDPQSFSRLPLLQRDQLSGEALKSFDAVAGKDANGKQRSTPPLGPVATSLYSFIQPRRRGADEQA